MHDRMKESVSALMDGELDELELRRLLSQADDPAMRATWHRYHQCSDLLRSDSTLKGMARPTDFVAMDISARVGAAVAQEPALGRSLAQRAGQWRTVGSFAVAASVAVLAVWLGRSLESPQAAVTQVASAGAELSTGRVYPAQVSLGNGGVSVSANLGDGALVPGARAQADLALQQRLQQLMLRHTEQAALNNSHGIIEFARVADLDSE